MVCGAVVYKSIILIQFRLLQTIVCSHLSGSEHCFNCPYTTQSSSGCSKIFILMFIIGHRVTYCSLVFKNIKKKYEKGQGHNLFKDARNANIFEHPRRHSKINSTIEKTLISCFFLTSNITGRP